MVPEEKVYQPALSAELQFSRFSSEPTLVKAVAVFVDTIVPIATAGPLHKGSVSLYACGADKINEIFARILQDFLWVEIMF